MEILENYYYSPPLLNLHPSFVVVDDNVHPHGPHYGVVIVPDFHIVVPFCLC
jgi:hypothetical protein